MYHVCGDQIFRSVSTSLGIEFPGIEDDRREKTIDIKGNRRAGGFRRNSGFVASVFYLDRDTGNRRSRASVRENSATQRGYAVIYMIFLSGLGCTVKHPQPLDGRIPKERVCARARARAPSRGTLYTNAVA